MQPLSVAMTSQQTPIRSIHPVHARHACHQSVAQPHGWCSASIVPPDTRLSGRCPAQRSERVRTAAAAQPAEEVRPRQTVDNADPRQAVALLERAAAKRDVPTERIVQAYKVLEKAKLPADGFPETLGGSKSPGLGWQLVYTTGERKWAERLGREIGIYNPITILFRWDQQGKENEIGVYLGPIAAFTVKGSWTWKPKKPATTSNGFSQYKLRLGPRWFTFDARVKAEKPEEADADGKRELMGGFTFAYAGEQVAAARGLGGGIALFARTTPSWQMSKGIGL